MADPSSYRLLNLPDLRESCLVGVAIAGVELGGLSCLGGVALVEDIEGHIERSRAVHAASVAQMSVHRRIGDPVETFADIHIDSALLNEVEHEWRAIECRDLHLAELAGQTQRGDDKLRHRIIDRDHNIDTGMR